MADPSPDNQAKPSRGQPQPMGSGLLLPWPRCCPWLVILAGVVVGLLVGFSPWLFLGIGVFCLLSGWIGQA